VCVYIYIYIIQTPRRWGSSRGHSGGKGLVWGGKGGAVRIALEGNIAAGKSTLLELIRTEFEVFTGED